MGLKNPPPRTTGQNSADQNNPYGLTAPPSGGPAATVSPIGVPIDYKAPTSHSVVIGVPGTVQRTSTENVYGTPLLTNPYMPGDEFAPAGDLNAIPIIQADMIAAGLLNKSDVRVGVWDAASASAYKDVLAFANQQGVSAQEALTILVSNPPLGKPGTGRAGQVVSYTNPADIASGYQNVSQQLTGQEQPTADFQDYFHGQEAAANASAVGAHNAALGGGTQSYVQPPSVSSAAQQYVLEHDPSQVLAYGVASRMGEFLSMLGVR